jgi:hypothetical protein
MSTEKLQKTLHKLKAYEENPELVKEPTSAEVASLVVLVLSQVGVLEQAIKDGRLDGKTPEADKDFMSKESALRMLTDAVNSKMSEVDVTVELVKKNSQDAVLEAIAQIRNGDDAVISQEQIQQAAEIAQSLIELPDFAKLVTTEITSDGASIRDALELFAKEEDKLSIESVGFLQERLDELKKAIVTTQGGTGTIGKQQVYGFIRQAIADGTIGSSGVEALVAGTNVTIDATDPANPIINASVPGGAGDMSASVYDPTGVVDDAFDMDNMAESSTKKILTSTERSAITANTAKVTYPSADSTKVGFVSVTQAVDLDTMESNIATNNSKVSYTDAAKVAGIEALADVTDTANVEAAGAVMDSELTSIADVKALNQSVISGADPVFGIENMTLDDTSLIVADTTNMQTFAEEVDDALLRARGTGISTTYVSTVSVGGTTFAQPTVKGEITSDEGYFRITYAGATGITVADLNATSTWVYIDKTGALQQQTTIPTRQDRTRKAFTMRIGVNTSTNQIVNFEYDNNPIGHYANSMRDLYEFLLIQGVPFKKDQLVTGRTDNLGFDVSSGELLEFGGTGDINNPNIKPFDEVTNTAYNLMSRTALVSSETNLVKYWDNAGTITPLGSTTCVGHRVYRFSSGNVAIQYGQGNYANMTLAKAGAKLEEYVLNPALKDATFFGWWLLEETATATSGTADAEFVEYTLGVQGGSSSGLSGALLKGNNLSDLLDASTSRTNIGLATTANQTDSTDKRFMTDAQETILDNTSNSNSGDNAANSSSATSAQGATADTAMQDLVDDTTPTLGGELDAGAHSIGFTMQTATGDGTTTVVWGNGNHCDFTFGAFNETFTFTAPAKPGVYTMSLKQDGTGSRTATWPATVKWPAGTAPTLTTTATTGYDVVSFRFDGTNYYSTSTLNFS